VKGKQKFRVVENTCRRDAVHEAGESSTSLNADAAEEIACLSSAEGGGTFRYISI